MRQLLEQEAERVYEKIRGNGYVADGRVQLEQIRDEALQLIRRAELPTAHCPLPTENRKLKTEN